MVVTAPMAPLTASTAAMRPSFEVDHNVPPTITGPAQVAHHKGLIAAGQKRIIADGLYTWTEYKILKKHFPQELTVVALVPPKGLRHKRIAARPDRQLTLAEVNDRDYNEIEQLEKGGPIAMADYFVVNKSSNLRTRLKIDEILREIDF